MAATQSNGRAKKTSKPKANGYLNGSANVGSTNGHLNGHADKSQSSSVAVRQRKQRRTFTAAVTSIVLRLSIWYFILTAAFRCPSSLTQLNNSSPRVCTPYLQARSYATPYLDPYYQAYLAPHVDKVKPYADRFERQVYTPAASFTRKQYVTYGAHRVEQAQKQAAASWDKTVRPHLQTAQDAAQAQYDAYLGHHVKRASDAASPYYSQVKASSKSVYHKSVLPAYEASLPYLHNARVHGRHVIVDVVFPHVRSAKDITWSFLLRNVWPQLRVLYGDNVEPQLVRISERLGRYRDQQKVESVVDAVESETSTTATESAKIVPTVAASSSRSIASFASASISSATEAASSVVNSVLGGDSSSATSIEAQPEASIDPKDAGLSSEELKEKLNEDLRKWQTKFAAAADKGAEDLEQRVTEITSRQVEKGVNGHGKALIVKLEESADSTIAGLKSFIKRTVQSLPEDATEKDLEAAHEQCSAKARELGQTVKQKAQDVREWKASYDTETDTLVQAAVKSTVEVLEKIHGLGLQEVGMRWAWTDGVTYKDWQNYHKLKSTLTEWQAEVESVGSRHEGLRVAHEEAKRLEDEAMSIASKNVNELVRLKDVAKWKLWAEDATDDFTNNAVPPRARKAAQQVLDNVGDASSKVSEAIVGSETPVSESVASSIKSAASDASSKMSKASSKVYESVVGSETPSTQSVLSQASSKASEAVIGGASSISSGASEAASSASSAASSVSSGASSAASEAKDVVVEKASTATESPKKVWGGVAAQVLVEAREPVFDDVINDDEDETYSVKLQSIVADAGDRASELTRAVSEALLGATKTQGSVESATSLASEQYAKAIAAASKALYGTQQQPLESATSVASVKFADAVTAASYAIYGTPTPTAVIKTVQVEVSSRYSNAVSLASEQLENAKSQLSILASGTKQPAYQTLLSGFEKAYSDSVAAASQQLQAALRYTESAKSYAAGPTQGYFESVSSIASSRLSEGLSQASAQFSTQPTSGVDSARRQYYEAIGLAHGRYSEFLGAASSAIHGPQQGTAESLASVASASASAFASAASVSAASVAAGVSDTVNSAAANAQSVASNAQAAAESLASQVSSSVIGSETPWTESVASQASENWEALIAKASSQVYGQPTPWAESVYSQAGAYGAQATARAAEQYAGIQALISELVVGKEPDFTESVMSRFASAYSTGLPAVVASAESYVNERYGSASSYAGENFEAATDYAADAYASASSVVSSIFTPPAAVETILSQANAQIDQALESASIAVYGTPKGAAEQASESVASAYASIQSQVSEAIYGTQQAQDSFTAAAVSAQAAISAAIFGTPTATGYAASITSGASDTYGSVVSGAGEAYSSVASNAGGVYDSAASGASEAYTSVASVASENADYAYSKISSAVYGPEQGAMESASSRIALAVEAANSRISEMYASASSNVGEAASSVSSVATEATQRVKDEL